MLTNISLFSGSGGIDLGLKWAGFKTLAAVELRDYAANTFRKNFPETYVFGPPHSSGDVREITGDDIRRKTDFWGEIDLLSGGPPCQPFSIAAGQRYGKGDERYKKLGSSNKEIGDLLPEYVRLVNELNPKVFLLENVDGLMNWNDGEYLTTSLAPLLDRYSISEPKIINAVNYGVPQHRKRLILIGTRLESKVVLPPETHGDTLFDSQPHTTVEEALKDIPTNVENNQFRKHKPETTLRYEKLPFGKRDKLGRVDRLHPNLPSKTIIAGGDKGGGRSHLHPYLPRTLSARECARIQTFPDDFVFSGAIGRQFTQVGNAVPPLLAFVLGHHIKNNILKISTPYDLSSVRHPIVSKFTNKALIKNS